MSDEHSLRHRALAVRELLRGLWGDALPDSPDPWLTMTLDGIAGDDETGRDRGYVVFGDGLPLTALRALRALVEGHPNPTTAIAALPPGLRERLRPDG